ncbi:hypothetical protein WICPIJ_000317 [Wickerhamomyces pijperi]|uniref:Uncharacterized protein n=1 Tax=Wickerhamomyces pijperi TaxID=599730 RepID=A0A9P8QDV0_WICPI|nr:hypothetical protein WICPIJ_000317 [Wickerhamomyces pijperi]
MSNLSLATPKPSQSHSRNSSITSIARPAATSPSKKNRFSTVIVNPLIIAPSFLEDRFGASIGGRAASLRQFHDIGTPDLLHISKYNKILKKEDGEYHYLTGVDMSNEVAAIAYISTLNFKYCNFNHERHPTSFTYCSYNAFSKEDVRVKKEFPGSGYSLQTVPSDPTKPSIDQISQRTWDELFVSSIVRAVIIGLDDERKLPSLVEKSIFLSINSTKNMIKQLVRFIDRGHLLGASEDVAKPSVFENYLLDTLYTIVEVSGLVDYAVSEIRSLSTIKYDLSLIIVKILLANDRENEAVQELHKAIKKNPRDQFLLNQQAKFLIRKASIDLAIEVAKRSTMIDPYGFEGWYLLSKAYFYKREYAQALLTLNNAQLVSSRPKDIISVNPKDKLTIPYPNEGKVKSIWESLTQVYGPGSHNLLKFTTESELNAVDPMISKVSKYVLKGSNQAVYELLVLFVDRLGWGGLLNVRAEVFIMDNEAHIVKNDISDKSAIITKRICETWLESILNIVFGDLRVAMIFDRQLNIQTRHSALEWELIGLTCLRTHYYSNAVSSLRTTINNQFDIVCSRALLSLWGKQRYDMEFQAWQRAHNQNTNKSFEVPLDQLIDVIVKVISYNTRFYNEGQLEMLIFLKKFFGVVDVDYISSRVQVLLEKDDVNDWKNSGCIPVFDKLVKDLKIFGEI